MLFYEGHKVYMNGEYPAVFIDGGNHHIHRLEWMKHYGEIPEGFIVHHKDENKLNWEIENLEILPRSEHILKHKDVVRRHGVRIVAIKDNMVEEFESIKECCEALNLNSSSIDRCFKGKQKQSHGWKFERR